MRSNDVVMAQAPVKAGRIPADAHARDAAILLEQLDSSPRGLSHAEAQSRLARYGRNALPRGRPPSLLGVFVRQFKSPLIYVLLAAASVSALLREWADAGFILAVLLINAAIGTFQEYAAERSALALQGLVAARTRVLRDGDTHEVPAEELVPGDVVLLEPGAKVPADLRLLEEHNLTIDESLLTGESLTVDKSAAAALPADSALSERINMAYAGTLVASGRGRGLVVATGLHTELGHIAASVLGKPAAKAPLLVRMERFTQLLAIGVGVAVLLVAALELARGAPPVEIFVLGVALAVSAIARMRLSSGSWKSR